MIPNLVRHDEWFDLSGSVFLEFVVREVERENCENLIRSNFSFFIRILGGGGVGGATRK